MSPRHETDASLRVRYVRSNRPRPRGAHVQEWRSERTGRTIEVHEMNAYRASTELEPGARGYLRYVDGVPVVGENPREVFSPRRYSRPLPHEDRTRSPRPPPGAALRRWWPWALVALAALLILRRALGA